MEFEDELMGQLIRFVSSHEVGHTLGLRHNFGSSSTVPVEKLRDKGWVEANGHTPSIMDYARFNYVAQPEDKIGDAGIFPRIGDYDIWAIEWGYRLYPQFKTPQAEKEFLNNKVIAKLKESTRYWFGTEVNPNDPRSQSEDLGNDAILASTYGIRNLKRIIPNLATWTKTPNEDYTNMKTIYDQVTAQFGRYMGHVTKYVGGIMETPKTIEQEGFVYEAVPASKQRAALRFLNQQLFTTPTWLIDNKVTLNTAVDPLTTVGRLQEFTLNRLISDRVFQNLSSIEAFAPGNSFSSLDMLAELKNGIFSEIRSGRTIDVYRRQLQKSYVNQLISYLKPPAASSINIPGLVIFSLAAGRERGDGQSAVRAHLEQLRTELTSGANRTGNAMSKAHLRDLSSRIQQALDPK